MRFLVNTLSYFLVGLIVPPVWGFLANHLGLFAGYTAAIMIIGPFWYLLHYRAWLTGKKDAAIVDMGLGIASAVFFRDSINHGLSSMLVALPSLAFLAFGAILGSFLAVKVNQLLDKEDSQ